jgi:hypothetical protein
MYWFVPHPVPSGLEQDTQRLVSADPLPVHCPTNICRGLHEVMLQGAQSVESVLVVPSQKPIWYCPGWQLPHGTHRLASKEVDPSHLPSE